MSPSPYDVWAAADTVELIREARVLKESLKAAFVINRRIARTAIGRDAAAALAQFEDVPVLAAFSISAWSMPRARPGGSR